MNSKFLSIAHTTDFIPNLSLYSPPWKLWSNHTDLFYISEFSMFFQIPVTLLMLWLPYEMPFSTLISGFSGGSDSKESACNTGDLGSISGLGRSPGEGNDYPLQYSCLENSMDRGVWWLHPWSHKELDITEWLHFHFSLSCIGEGNGNPLQYSCLENPRDRGA